MRKRRDIPFSFMFWACGIFIVGCGLTHLMGAVQCFIPLFWLGVYVNLVTAIASIITIWYLFPAIKQIVALPLPQEITKKNEQIQQLYAASQERIQALEAFNYSAAHDLNAPLRTLEGFSEILLQDYGDKFDTNGRMYITKMRISAIKMRNLIKDLLRLSRIGSTTSDLKLNELSLSNMVKVVLAECTLADPERKVELVIENDVKATGDPEILSLAVSNLLSNAWKFTSKNPKARIEFGSTMRDNERVYFVKDNGVGFDQSKVHFLFKPFNRLHTQQEFEGNGIGLTIVQKAIELHKGRVWAEGKVNEGATFYFTLGT